MTKKNSLASIIQLHSPSSNKHLERLYYGLVS